MYVGTDFDPINEGETDVFTFEFSKDLPNTRTITNASVACKLLSTDAERTVDASPSSRVSGPATVTTQSTRTFINQLITGMIAGNTYVIEATAQTSDGCTLKRYAKLYCEPIT